MPSLGETRVHIANHICGFIRLQRVVALDAVYPRLGLELGVDLRDQDASFGNFPKPIGQFELKDLTGELRLSRNGDAVGYVYWAGLHHSVRSRDFAEESHVRLACDLDPVRLEAIEAKRAGKPPMLWLELWPTLVAGSIHLDGYLDPIQAEVPRDQWLAFLAKARSVAFDVIEIPIPPGVREGFEEALARLREAREKIDHGDYQGAMNQCRKSIESMSAQVGKGNDALETFFKGVAGKHVGEAYLGIASRLKKLGNWAVHGQDSPADYSRHEAVFAVRTTEAILGLMSSLLERGNWPDGETKPEEGA